MASMAEIATHALRKIGVIAADTDPTAFELNDAVDALNRMLHEWSLRGVNTTHTTLDGNSAFPLAAAYEDGTIYMLAARISPNFAMPVGFDADDFFRSIQAAYMTIEKVSFDTAVTEVPSKKERDGTLGYHWR